MQPASVIREAGIRLRVRMLIVIASGGLAVFAAMAFVTIAEVRSGSAAFRENRLAYEVARDFANPSQSLTGGEVFFHSIQSANDVADIENVKDQLRRAEVRIEAGHAYYTQTMPPGPLRDLVTGDAYQSTTEWYALAEREYIPAVERGDFPQAQRIRIERLDPLVLKDTAANAEITRLTNMWIVSNAAIVESTVRSRRWQLAGVGLITLLIQLLLGLVIDSSVGSSTRRLSETLDELRRKSEEVEAFVYIVSHDLRAPLVNVQGFSRELEVSCASLKATLAASALPEPTRDTVTEILDEEIGGALKFISASASKFERLIDALLGLSRHGRQVYRIEKVDVAELAASSIASLRHSALDAGATIRIAALPPVYADVTALGQVFSNLVGNSLKYRSPERPLEIEIGGEAAPGAVHFWVRDNGLGIPESGMTRLFQVFQRLHPNQAPGEGMGLAIVQRIVERHGGRIFAESHEGEGTTVHFSLPGSPRPAHTDAHERNRDVRS